MKTENAMKYVYAFQEGGREQKFLLGGKGANLAEMTKLGLPVRFHDLRGSHETMLLDAGVPLHVVAARCGHTPAVLLRSYAKRTRKADTSAAVVGFNLHFNTLAKAEIMGLFKR